MISLIEMACENCAILFEADNGFDLQKKIDKKNLPDIVLMDVNMSGMDGFASVRWLKENYPDIKVLVVSMIEKEETIIQMLKLGVKGYLCKDVEPEELREALKAIAHKGFYYTDFITGKLVHSLQIDGQDKRRDSDLMNEQEKKFLQFACSEMTYHEIADKMFLSPKTIDGYRNSLFEKLNVKSRVGLVMYAVRNRIVKLDWEF
ncbi:response regulator [Chryseolinea soli]|uniref:response regulator n=1 Tax=Chryseolinea soli TaxID=2321403 RepID=UPI001F3ED6C9|nr:response regulator transcription factor [Chryseolinea soli]